MKDRLGIGPTQADVDTLSAALAEARDALAEAEAERDGAQRDCPPRALVACNVKGHVSMLYLLYGAGTLGNPTAKRVLGELRLRLEDSEPSDIYRDELACLEHVFAPRAAS